MTIINSTNSHQYIPLVGDINRKNPIAYQVNQGMVAVTNMLQMALAEAYINGLELPDSVLRSLLNTSIPIFFRYFPSLLVLGDWVLKESDEITQEAKYLMKVQYDLPQAMLNTMIEDGKLIYPKYSMALWEKGASTLVQAQIDMLDDAIEKLDIQDGDNILDIGCGWGSAANYILSKFASVKVTGLNLSHQQCEYMRRKMQDSDSYLSSGRFTLAQGDFKDSRFDTKFDKILSIGVFEHIGNLTKAFQNLASFLKEDGKIFIHIITSHAPNNISSPFLHKYVFPYGRIWGHHVIPSRNKDLKTIKQWYLNGSNYSKTLIKWLQNFDKNQAIYKDLDYGMNYAKFRRIWRLYLIWSIGYFDSCDGEFFGNGQYLMVHA
jgi:cyclopropane-fatty-acyl-phospholipid synthase